MVEQGIATLNYHCEENSYVLLSIGKTFHVIKNIDCHHGFKAGILRICNREWIVELKFSQLLIWYNPLNLHLSPANYRSNLNSTFQQTFEWSFSTPSIIRTSISWKLPCLLTKVFHAYSLPVYFHIGSWYSIWLLRQVPHQGRGHCRVWG